MRFRIAIGGVCASWRVPGWRYSVQRTPEDSFRLPGRHPPRGRSRPFPQQWEPWRSCIKPMQDRSKEPTMLQRLKDPRRFHPQRLQPGRQPQPRRDDHGCARRRPLAATRPAATAGRHGRDGRRLWPGHPPAHPGPCRTARRRCAPTQFSGGTGEFRAGSFVRIPGLHEVRLFPLRDQSYRPLHRWPRPPARRRLQSVEGLSLGLDMTVRWMVDATRLARAVPQVAG